MKLKPKSKVQPRSKSKSVKLATGIISATLLLSAVSPAIGYAAASTSPVAASISVANNKAGVKDTVKVTGLVAGDIVKVYNAATSGTLMGTATVANDATEALVEIDQLGSGTGSVYVTVTSGADTESARAVKAYESETSVAPSAGNITINNEKTGSADTIKVIGLTTGDVVTVYGSVIESATVAEGATEVTVSKADLLTATGGTAQVSVTKLNKLESARTSKTYISEPVSAVLAANTISVVNNKAGVQDKVTVTGLTTGDVVNVYKAATGGTAIGTATVAADATSAIVTIDQLGTATGLVYVSVKNADKLESARTSKAYDSETSAVLAATSIAVTNNATGTADTVKVTGLAEGDIVNVYAAATGGTALDTATVASGATEVTISKNDLLIATGGTAYVSVTKANKLESARTAAKYATETVAATLLPAAITATNNKAGVDDTVVVTGLVEGDIVNVYKAATGGTAIGTATVGTGATTATVTITQLGAAASNVYVSVKKDGELESVRTVKAYDAEITAAPVATTITATNNATGTADTVKITGLAEGDIVNVYAAATGGTALDTATVASGATEVTISKNDLLTATGGTAYVSVTKANKLESARTAAKYATETVATAPLAATITATNNKAGVDDTVVITGLAEGDIVNVYAAATGGTAIGTATVGTGATTATVTIEQLGVAAGSVYVSVKKEGQLESTRTAAKYVTEPVSTAPLATTITA
ncbi:hypothetical protein, partial [Paenibacillus sinopodophylli]|uniref:hypothetical protein n=1 Tax=Paenibacillus sinopodophylli TaxID=1837342 RepID=UPI001BB1C2BA